MIMQFTTEQTSTMVKSMGNVIDEIRFTQRQKEIKEGKK